MGDYTGFIIAAVGVGVIVLSILTGHKGPSIDDEPPENDGPAFDDAGNFTGGGFGADDRD